MEILTNIYFEPKTSDIPIGNVNIQDKLELES